MGPRVDIGHFGLTRMGDECVEGGRDIRFRMLDPELMEARLHVL